jgi:hypothetical protein
LEFGVRSVSALADVTGGLTQRFVLIKAHSLLAKRICGSHNSSIKLPVQQRP